MVPQADSPSPEPGVRRGERGPPSPDSARRTSLVVCGMFAIAGSLFLLLPDLQLASGSRAADPRFTRDAVFLAVVTVLLYVLLRRALDRAADDAPGAEASLPTTSETGRLAELGRASADVAHDLNNVLAAIDGYADLALRRAAQQDPLRPDLLSIRRAAARGKQLARRTLELGRRPDPRPELLDLGAVLVDLGRLLPGLMGETITVAIEPAREPAVVLADLTDMEQLVLNLASNAREAMPEGGRLVVSLQRQAPPGAPPSIVLTVSDTGRGMDEATRARAFEPFFTTRPDGTGLGLATVAAVARRAGGSVACESAPGRGTTIRVSLPAAQAASDAPRSPTTPTPTPTAAASPTAATAPTPTPTTPGRAVLVVDDDPALCDVLVRMLRDGGYSAKSVLDGRQAVEAVSRGGVDVVLCDMLMPEKEGLETIAELRQGAPDVPVIAMSGALRGDSYLGMAARLGAVASLRKPFERDSLLAAVSTALQRRPVGPREEAGAV